jgi:hypothetical protein
MQRVLFLYALFLALLLLGAVSFPDEVKAVAKSNPNKELGYHQWVITSAHELDSGKNLSDEYTSTVWQFLEEGHFLQFKEDVMIQNGKWSMKGNKLQLRMDDLGDAKEFSLQLLRRNELILKNREMEIKLLKLVN